MRKGRIWTREKIDVRQYKFGKDIMGVYRDKKLSCVFKVKGNGSESLDTH